MSAESYDKHTEGRNPIPPSQAHELCKKAKEALDKANKLLAESSKQQQTTQQRDEGERP